jgi:hypothetical protein
VLVRILQSPRRRRRLAIAILVAALAAPLAYLAVHFSTPGSQENANGPNIAESSIYRQPKRAPFTAEKRRAVRKVLARFIATAVARNRVGDSWELAGPSLRQDISYKQWSKGDIPIVPYPAAKHGQGSWDAVNYSYRNEVGLEVLLFPKPGSGYSIATVDTNVVRGRDGRWRVDYWMITKLHGPGATAPADSASAFVEGAPNVHKLPGKNNEAKARPSRERAEADAAPAASSPTHLDRKWIVVPLGLLSLVIVIPLGIATFVWIRNRRATAAYRRAR